MFDKKMFKHKIRKKLCRDGIIKNELNVMCTPAYI